MAIFNNLKQRLFQNKIKKTKHQRQIKILPTETYHSILIIIEPDQNEEDIRNHLTLVFSKAKFTTLTTREDKVDNSSGFAFTYHPSDLNLGGLKNERLIGLTTMNFDLIIDFVSNSSPLDYFVQNCVSSLKIGDLHASKNYLYDILLDRGNSLSDFINTIKTQINILSSNGNS